jgi:hypothetical protein
MAKVLGGEIRQSRAVLLEEVEADVLGPAVRHCAVSGGKCGDWVK